jgi:hypothetical protein
MVVTDNAQNMLAAVRHSELKSLPCFIHTLQLVLKDSVFKQSSVNNIKEKCSKIAEKFNRSKHLFESFEKYQKQYDVPGNRFIQYVSTRWNSMYNMFARVLEQKKAFVQFASDHSQMPCLESGEWHHLEKLVKLLKIFNDVTIFLSSREENCSSIIPTIEATKNLLMKAKKSDLFEGLQGTITEIEEAANTRFLKYLHDKNLITATFLDPRYKIRYFQTDYNEGVLKQDLVMRFSHENESLQVVTDGGTESVLQEIPIPNDQPGPGCSNAEESFNFLDAFDNNDDDTNSKASNDAMDHTNTIREMDKYIEKAAISKGACPFSWWRENRLAFPLLSQSARRYLGCPPTSVESERLFSVGGNVYTPKRNRLQPDTGEKVMFLHYNLRVTE